MSTVVDESCWHYVLKLFKRKDTYFLVCRTETKIFFIYFYISSRGVVMLQSTAAKTQIFIRVILSPVSNEIYNKITSAKRICYVIT